MSQAEPRSETQPSNLPEGKVHHHQLKNDDESRGRPGQDEYARKNQERAYSADLDTAFWGTGSGAAHRRAGSLS
jgi:hypothetical protein